MSIDMPEIKKKNTTTRSHSYMRKRKIKYPPTNLSDSNKKVRNIIYELNRFYYLNVLSQNSSQIKAEKQFYQIHQHHYSNRHLKFYRNNILNDPILRKTKLNSLGKSPVNRGKKANILKPYYKPYTHRGGTKTKNFHIV